MASAPGTRLRPPGVCAFHLAHLAKDENQQYRDDRELDRGEQQDRQRQFPHAFEQPVVVADGVERNGAKLLQIVRGRDAVPHVYGRGDFPGEHLESHVAGERQRRTKDGEPESHQREFLHACSCGSFTVLSCCQHLAPRTRFYLLAASTIASNSFCCSGSLAALSSGCHCTAISQGWLGISIASMVPSSACPTASKPEAA